MFDDLETALELDARKRRRLCKFGRWIATLSEEDGARATNLVLDEDRRYNCRELARYFRSKGADLNDQVLVRHRNRQCC